MEVLVAEEKKKENFMQGVERYLKVDLDRWFASQPVNLSRPSTEIKQPHIPANRDQL